MNLKEIFMEEEQTDVKASTANKKAEEIKEWRKTLGKNRSKMYRLVESNIKLANYIGAFPAFFDGFHLRVSTSICDRAKNYFSIFVGLCVGFYFSGHLVVVNLEKDESFEYGIAFMAAVCYLSSILFNLMLLYLLPGISEAVSDGFAVMRYFERNNFVNGPPDAKFIHVIILKLFTSSTVVYPIGLAIFGFMMREARLSPLMYLPPDYRHWSITAILCFILWWQGLCFWCIINFFMSEFILLHMYFGIMSKEISLGQRSYLTKDSVRQAENLVRPNRMMTLQLNFITEMARGALPPVAVMANRTILASNWIVINCINTMPLLNLALFGSYTVLTTSAWVTILILTFKVSENHQKVTDSLALFTSKNNSENRYVQKYLKSCRPVVFRIGDYSVISKPSPADFLQDISNGTVTLLMAV